MTVGREAIGGAAVAREPALMHGGGGQGLGPMHCATDIWEKQHVRLHQKTILKCIMEALILLPFLY